MHHPPHKRRPRLALFTVVALLGLQAGLGTAATEVPVADPASEIETMLRDQAAAWNRGDLDTFLGVYLQGEELTFFSGTTVTRGFEGFAARFRARYTEGDNRMDPLTFSDLEIETLGDDAAFVRGRWSLDVPDGDDPGGLFTLILRRLPEAGWRIVHDHTS